MSKENNKKLGLTVDFKDRIVYNNDICKNRRIIYGRKDYK